MAVSVAVLATLVVFAAPGGAGPQQPDYKKSGAGRGDTIVNTAQEVYSEEAHDHAQHGGEGGHLPASNRNVALIGRAAVHDRSPGRVSDVAFLRNERFGDFAYVGLHAGGRPPPECSGGIDVFDVNDPRNPVNIGFLPSARNTYATEGIQALHVDTPHFTGDLLLVSNEACGPGGPKEPFEGLGGMTIWDITNPRKPVKMVSGVGDTTFGHFQNKDAAQEPAHEAHSIFGWQAGDRLFALLVDNEELLDLDIFDLTDPRNPRQIAETGMQDWPDAEVDAYGDFPNTHDFQVKRIDGRYYAMISEWDAGWVLLDVTKPKFPVFIDDFNYPDCDPEYPEAPCPPEGNAHQGEWNRSGELFIGTDEDESAFRLIFSILEGPHAGTFDAGEFSWTVPIATLPDRQVNGPTVFGGYACPDDRVPTPAQAGVTLRPGEEAILVVQRGPVGDPNHPHDACFFSEKVETAQDAGWDAVIIANHHAGSGAGAQPDAFICGSKGHDFTVTIPGICVGHRAMHLIFDTGQADQTYPPDYTFPYPEGDPGDVEPDVGDRGSDISAAAVFDGWGYPRLIDADTLQYIDGYTIPAQHNPEIVGGGIDLSIHEVAVERNRELRRLAYFSWYSAGFRVGRFNRTEIREVGHFIPKGGHDLWGVELGPLAADGRRLVMVSDRDFGLFIYKYTGPIP